METGATPVLRSGEVESGNHSRINKIDLGHADVTVKLRRRMHGGKLFSAAGNQGCVKRKKLRRAETV